MWSPLWFPPVRCFFRTRVNMVNKYTSVTKLSGLIYTIPLLEVKRELEREKEILRERIGNCWKYRKKVKDIKKNAKVHRKIEEERLNKKMERLRKIWKDEEEKKL